MEGKVEECYFESEICDDYPGWENEDSTEWNNLKEKYGEAIDMLFIENFLGEASTKFGGYPYWLQDPNHPDCGCGSQKEFFFQLGNNENYGLHLNGDGIIYYFVCK